MWRKDIEFDMETDCPKNKKAYDNECYDCDWHACCLARIEEGGLRNELGH